MFSTVDIVKKSELFRELNIEISSVPQQYQFDNDDIEVVAKLKIKDNGDFVKILDKLRFWMIDKIPTEIFDYALKNRDTLSNIDLNNFKDFYYEELKILIQLIIIK